MNKIFSDRSDFINLENEMPIEDRLSSKTVYQKKKKKKKKNFFF